MYISQNGLSWTSRVPVHAFTSSFWLLSAHHVLCNFTSRLSKISLRQGDDHVSSGIWHHGHSYVCVSLEELAASILRVFQTLVSQDHNSLNVQKPERSVMNQSSPVHAFTSSFCKEVLISSSHISWCLYTSLCFYFNSCVWHSASVLSSKSRDAAAVQSFVTYGIVGFYFALQVADTG